MASSFARLARSAEHAGRLQVSKEPVDNPPYDIHTLGDQVLRSPAKRIGKRPLQKPKSSLTQVCKVSCTGWFSVAVCPSFNN